MANERFTVGELEIVRVLELEFPLPRSILPVGRDPEALVAECDWAKPHFLSEAGDVVFALSGLGVVSGGRRIVIDPCTSFDLRRDNPDIRERAAANIWIESRGETAVIVGDHILNPIQCADPDWTGLDQHPEASPGIRRALLEECAERHTLMIGPHWGSPGAGRVRREAETWRLDAER